MNRLQMRIILCCTVLLCAAAVASATTFRHLEPAELTAAAELAFSGTVLSTDVELRDGEPWTIVTFAVTTLLRDTETGAVEDGRLSLAFLGGSVAGQQLNVALMPGFEAGQQVLLLAYADEYWSPVVGFAQGVWWLSDTGQWLDMWNVPLGLSEDGELVLGEASGAAEVEDHLAGLLERP